MTDPQEDNLVLGVQNFGSTGANNDIEPTKSGETLESLVTGAKTNGFTGVPDYGQQEPVSK